jgi:hypothetical protein
VALPSDFETERRIWWTDYSIARASGHNHPVDPSHHVRLLRPIAITNQDLSVGIPSPHCHHYTISEARMAVLRTPDQAQGARNPTPPPIMNASWYPGTCAKPRNCFCEESRKCGTTKQSAHQYRKRVNRDCFVVLHTQHPLSALLATTRIGLFQQSLIRGNSLSSF